MKLIYVKEMIEHHNSKKSNCDDNYLSSFIDYLIVGCVFGIKKYCDYLFFLHTGDTEKEFINMLENGLNSLQLDDKDGSVKYQENNVSFNFWHSIEYTEWNPYQKRYTYDDAIYGYDNYFARLSFAATNNYNYNNHLQTYLADYCEKSNQSKLLRGLLPVLLLSGWKLQEIDFRILASMIDPIFTIEYLIFPSKHTKILNNLNQKYDIHKVDSKLNPRQRIVALKYLIFSSLFGEKLFSFLFSLHNNDNKQYYFNVFNKIVTMYNNREQFEQEWKIHDSKRWHALHQYFKIVMQLLLGFCQSCYIDLHNSDFGNDTLNIVTMVGQIKTDARTFKICENQSVNFEISNATQVNEFCDILATSWDEMGWQASLEEPSFQQNLPASERILKFEPGQSVRQLLTQICEENL